MAPSRYGPRMGHTSFEGILKHPIACNTININISVTLSHQSRGFEKLGSFMLLEKSLLNVLRDEPQPTHYNLLLSLVAQSELNQVVSSNTSSSDTLASVNLTLVSAILSRTRLAISRWPIGLK